MTFFKRKFRFQEYKMQAYLLIHLKYFRNIISEKDNLRQIVKSTEKFAELMHKVYPPSLFLFYFPVFSLEYVL